MKFYKVKDNSYQECLNDGKNHYLAGVGDDYGETVEVIVQPFNRTFESRGKQCSCQFIIGKCKKGNLHLIFIE